MPRARMRPGSTPRATTDWVRDNPINDYTIPRTALTRGEKLQRVLETRFGGLHVEDLERGFFCVSADLRTQSLVVHRSGPLWFALAAGISVPVIAPPRVAGRQLLIDGSLLANLPVETMAATGEGPVIAIDVRTGSEHEPGRAAAVADQQRGARPPALLDTLGRVLLLASAKTSEQAHRHADVVIAPRITTIGLLEFHQIDAAIEAGAAAAREALERLGPTLGLP